MKQILLLAIVLISGTTSLWARDIKKIDRGTEVHTFIPKGQWMVGASFAYSEESNKSFEFMSLLKDINAEAYSFKVTPLVSYFIRDNLSIGARFSYGRNITDIDKLSLELGDINLDVEEFTYHTNNYTGTLFLRNYINLGDSKRFAIINEARASYGYSETNTTSDFGSGVSGVYQLKHNLNFTVAPGLTCFINEFSAVEASVAVAGLNFNWYDQKKDQVYDGKRNASSANFKINLLSIELGVVFYL